jgi:hypothetical protein
LADGARANAIPNVASGEGSHEAAKPEGVIHRYISAQCYILGQWQPKKAAFDAVFDPRCTA